MPEGYVFNWTAVALAAIVGLLGMVAMFAAAYILSPRRPSRVKGTPYECGIPPAPHSWSQLHIRYYIFAILFLIFDVEAVFIFPWSVIFLGSKLAFYAMLIFLAVLFFAIIYGWRKGVLEWWK